MPTTWLKMSPGCPWLQMYAVTHHGNVPQRAQHGPVLEPRSLLQPPPHSLHKEPVLDAVVQAAVLTVVHAHNCTHTTTHTKHLVVGTRAHVCAVLHMILGVSLLVMLDVLVVGACGSNQECK